ncbi:MAG TPA: MarC family protein [Candidatus Binatia bacterium]|nr:MarC family protein [Candidatus Binatia bacterium]
MDNVAQFALVSLTSLLFIVDPIAVVPAYLVITDGETSEDQRRTAKRACIVMTILLIFFAATGNLLFRAFGITLPAFKTAGGLILWYVAMDMLHGERRTQEGQEEVLEGQTKEDVAITPLAIPMLAGPGAISTVVVLSSQAQGLLELGIVYGSVVITGLVSYLVLRIGENLLRRLGKTGIRVLTRIMGLILAAVAVQFVLSGIKEAFGI